LEARPRTGAGLDQHLVAVAHQLGDRRRHQADPILVVLDLLRHSDAHGTHSFRPASLAAPRPARPDFISCASAHFMRLGGRTPLSAPNAPLRANAPPWANAP